MSDNELAKQLALKTGELLVGLRNHAHSLETLGDDSHAVLAQEILGSEGDLVGHSYLLEQLTKLRPSDVVLSEEGDRNIVRAGVKRIWIIDPLDGTTQYSTGGSDFAVHVALWDAGCDTPSKISAAAVSVPMRNEIWTMADAAISNDEPSGPIRILVSRSRPPLEISAVVSALEFKFPERGPVEVISMGSVGAKVGAIISGEADIYFNTGGFYEWDLAAPLGVAIHHGLSVTDCQGNSIALNQPDLRVRDVLISRTEFVETVITALARS
jgi:3'(2'), 5'-bisphosphate nucleotidase